MHNPDTGTVQSKSFKLENYDCDIKGRSIFLKKKSSNSNHSCLILNDKNKNDFHATILNVA